MNARWKYCKHCKWCRVKSQKKATFRCAWEGASELNMKQRVCPIYHAETHEEALEALMLLRLTNAPK